MDRTEYNQSLKPGLIQAVRDYQAAFPAAGSQAEQLLAFIEGQDDLFGRDSEGGHITCSAWVLDHSAKRAVLVFHRRLARWVQPGGHIEPFETPLEGALREAGEETGIVGLQLLDGKLFHLEVFRFPDGKDGPAHTHYDLRYLIQAPPGAEVSAADESDGAAWIPLDELADYSEEETIRAMALKTAQWLLTHRERP